MENVCMKKIMFTCFLMGLAAPAFCWGFFGHKMINQFAVYLLPPEMMILYKPHIDFIIEHAVDPDKRRYAVKEEGSRHYIDIDKYLPVDSIPMYWSKAVEKYGADTLEKHGIVPWWIQTMMSRLTLAFEKKDKLRIIKLSAEIGHYIADLHVPLHASSNHNGQLTGQHGIHGFWESRIPELLAIEQFDLLTGKAVYIRSIPNLVWKVARESAAAADTVLTVELELSKTVRQDSKYAFEERNGVIIRQYSSVYSKAYDHSLNGMVERRMRNSIYAVASCWYTAWVNAGQPDLSGLANMSFTTADLEEWELLNKQWKESSIKGRSCAN